MFLQNFVTTNIFTQVVLIQRKSVLRSSFIQINAYETIRRSVGREV
jgi:hypothetical protein